MPEYQKYVPRSIQAIRFEDPTQASWIAEQFNAREWSLKYEPGGVVLKIRPPDCVWREIWSGQYIVASVRDYDYPSIVSGSEFREKWELDE